LECLSEVLIKVSKKDVQKSIEGLWGNSQFTLNELCTSAGFNDLGNESIFSVNFKPLYAYENGSSAFYKFELLIDDEKVAQQVSLVLKKLKKINAHWIIVNDFEGWGWFIGSANNPDCFQYYDSIPGAKKYYKNWMKKAPTGVHIGTLTKERENCKYRADHRVFEGYIEDNEIDLFFSQLTSYKSQEDLAEFLLSMINPSYRESEPEAISKFLGSVENNYEKLCSFLDDAIEEAGDYLKERHYLNYVPNKILSNNGKKVLFERKDGKLYAPIHRF